MTSKRGERYRSFFRARYRAASAGEENGSQRITAQRYCINRPSRLASAAWRRACCPSKDACIDARPTLRWRPERKWKPLILWHLGEGGVRRFLELQRLIPGITRKMLTQHLRELERDGVVARKIFNEMPLRVEYSRPNAPATATRALRLGLETRSVHRSKRRKAVGETERLFATSNGCGGQLREI